MQRARSAECFSEEIAETGIALDDVTSDGPAAPPSRPRPPLGLHVGVPSWGFREHVPSPSVSRG